MRKGTTPVHTFDTSIDLTGAEKLYITYKQRGKTIAEKTIDDATITTESVVVTLTQAETLAFCENESVSIQIRAKFADGTAVASNIIKQGVLEVLKLGEI